MKKFSLKIIISGLIASGATAVLQKVEPVSNPMILFFILAFALINMVLLFDIQKNITSLKK